MNRQEVVTYAKTLVGIPYNHMGRNGLNDKPSGLDCAGVFLCIADHFGLPYRDILGSYSRYPGGQQIERLFSRWMVPIEKTDNPPMASVALMYQVGYFTRGKEPPQHAFLVTQSDPLRILHAHDSPTFRRVVESPIPYGYLRRITHLFDFPGIED